MDNTSGIEIVRTKELPHVSLNIQLTNPGTRIRQARQEKNLTMKEIADQIGISMTAIGKIERGVTTPSLPTLRNISLILERPISYLGCFENLPQESLGQKLKKARLYQGLFVTEVANIFNVNVKTIKNWESDRRVPTIISNDVLEEFLSTIKK